MARKMSIIDVKLAQGAAMLFLIIIAKAIPALAEAVLEMNIWIWMALLVLICSQSHFTSFGSKNSPLRSHYRLTVDIWLRFTLLKCLTSLRTSHVRGL